MAAIELTAAPEANNIRPSKASLVDACGRNPDVIFLGADGDVPAGGGRHFVAVNPLHDIDDLIAWMSQWPMRQSRLPHMEFQHIMMTKRRRLYKRRSSI